MNATGEEITPQIKRMFPGQRERVKLFNLRNPQGKKQQPGPPPTLLTLSSSGKRTLWKNFGIFKQTWKSES